jgi:hypothetical protein
LRYHLFPLVRKSMILSLRTRLSRIWDKPIQFTADPSGFASGTPMFRFPIAGAVSAAAKIVVMMIDVFMTLAFAI